MGIPYFWVVSTFLEKIEMDIFIIDDQEYLHMDRKNSSSFVECNLYQTLEESLRHVFFFK